VPKRSAAVPLRTAREQNHSCDPNPPKQPNKIIVPSEPFYGGKTRLGPDILKHAPIQRGRKLIDLFAGRANLLWQALKLGFKFEHWILNDPIQLPFFEAVRAIGHRIKVPPRSREEFERQRELAKQGDQRAIALAPWLCYNGGNYGCGLSDGERGNGHRSAGGRRTPESEERNLLLMHKFLNDKKMRLSGLDWRDCLEAEKPSSQDLILIDWPYLDCYTGAYESDNVLPIEGIEYLKSHPDLNFVLCEHDQPLYRYAFGPPILQKEIQLRSTNFRKTGQETRIESVWTSASYQAHLAKTGAKVPEVLHATLQPTPIKDDGSWTIPNILKELRAVADRIEKNKLEVSAEERLRLLPLLIILKKLTKRKKPGYHAALASIGLNASTVRSWFYRGLPTDEIIAMLEPEQEPRQTGNYDDSRGRSAEEDAADLAERFLLLADKIVAALLRDKIVPAKKLAREYAEARKIAVGSDAHRELKKAA
jgi:hypothetical protein